MTSDKEFDGVGANAITTDGPNGTAVSATLPNSLNEGKPLADDGSLYSSVSDAISAASSWVFVPPGTFNENVTITTNGLELVGSGRQTVIDAGASSPAVAVDADNVLLQDFHVTCGSSNGSSLIAEQNTHTGITARRISGIHGDTSASVYTISLSNGSNHKIINCRDKNAGFRVRNESVLTESISRNGYTAHLCRYDSIISYCISVNARNNGVRLNRADSIGVGNRVHNAANNGVSTDNDAPDCIIANNRISDSGSNDILDGGGSALIDGNDTATQN